MNKPDFKTAGIMAAAATSTIVIFARTKPPASDSRGRQGIQKSDVGQTDMDGRKPELQRGERQRVFRGGVYGDMFSARRLQNYPRVA